MIDDALRLHAAREREHATKAMNLAPKSTQEQEEYAAWRELRRAAAERLITRPALYRPHAARSRLCRLPRVGGRRGVRCRSGRNAV